MTDARHTITITVAWPPPALSPNARCHWAVRARAARDYRFAARLVALDAMNRRELAQSPPWRRALLRLVAYTPTRRRFDWDNLLASLKPAIDGLRDAGLIVEDTTEGLTILQPRRELRRGGRREIEMCLAPYPEHCRHCGREFVPRTIAQRVCPTCCGRQLVAMASDPPPPPRPTATPPGTKARVQCYRERAEAGYALHHPDDRTNDSVPELSHGRRC